MVSKSKITPRGIRNNNPGNIKLGSNWKGLSPVQTDDTFCQFDTMEYGIRAMIYLFKKYVQKYHLYSIRQLISRWCPNDSNYIKFVSDSMGYLPDEPIFKNPADRIDSRFWSLCKSVSWFECHYVLQFDEFQRAWRLL